MISPTTKALITAVLTSGLASPHLLADGADEPERPDPAPLIEAVDPPLDPFDRASDRPRLVDLDPEELAARLDARLAELDEARALLAEAAAAVRAGTPPREVLGPIAGWMLERGPMRDRPGPRGGPGRGFGLEQPGPGPRARPDARPDAGDRPELGDRPERFGHTGPDGQDGPRGGPGGLGGPGGPGGPGAMVSDEATLAFIREHFPPLAERLDGAGVGDPEIAGRLLARLKPRLADAIMLQDEDPVFVELRVAELKVGFEIMQTARRLGGLIHGNGPADARTETEARLRGLLAEQFEIEQKLALHRVERESAQIDTMLERIGRRAADRDAILEEHFARVRERAGRGRPLDRGPDDD